MRVKGASCIMTHELGALPRSHSTDVALIVFVVVLLERRIAIRKQDQTHGACKGASCMSHELGALGFISRDQSFIQISLH